MNAALTWRKATLRDCVLLARFNQHLIQDEQSRTRLTLPQLRRRMAGWLRSRYHAVIFEQDQSPVAYALYRREAEEGGIYLRQFFVKRGLRRMGVGRAAIRLLLDECLAGESPINLGVLTHNKPAHAFWKATGFQDSYMVMEFRRRKTPRSRARRARQST